MEIKKIISKFNSVQSPTLSVHTTEQIRLDKTRIDENIKEKNRFNKPTIIEIEERIKEKNYSIDANYFFNFYESKGWMVGRNKMKKWESALAGWESRNKEKDKQKDPYGVAGNV